MLALGIDVGGTKTALGVINVKTGQIERRILLATPQPKAGIAFLAELAGCAAQLDPSYQLPIGIGLCELVTNKQQIASAWRVEWTAGTAARAFQQWPSVTLEADVRAAAIAEATFGAGHNLQHWIYANAGTGIATVLMNGQKPHRGANGLGMAWGMSPVSLRGECQDSKSQANVAPVIEDLCGGAGLLRNARNQGLECETIAELSNSEDPRAVNLLANAGFTLGAGLGTLANMLDPEGIVLGGGVALGSTSYRSGIKQGLEFAVWPQGRDLPVVLSAALGADSGLIGAAFVGSTQPVSSMR